MKAKIILLGVVLMAAIGIGISMNTGFAEESYVNHLPPQKCICSAPTDLATLANRARRYESSLKSNLEPKFLMSLYNCQCGSLSCAVSAQAISCRK